MLKILRIFAFVVVAFFMSPICYAQWAANYGGTANDIAQAIQQTTDGRYVVAGYTKSFGADNKDLWVLKLNSDGSVAWQKIYRGDNEDFATFVQQTTDGGYIVAGVTDSFSGGYSDFWVLKLNSDGSVAWQKTYGGSNNDEAHSIQQTSDGGYVVTGYANSFGAGGLDLWVLKLNSDGSVAWQKTYGGSNNDESHSIQQTSDGGYVIAGHTWSFGAGNADFWVLKLNSDGSVVWQKSYGGTGFDIARYIQQTSDGGYVVTGYANSFGAGGLDFWVLKLNSDGSVAWQKSYGGSGNELAYSIQQTLDGGYAVAGYTYSFGAGSHDFWVLKLNSDGSVAWQKTYGGSGNELAYSIQQTSDGGYGVAGYTNSFGAGNDDFWVLAVNSAGNIPNCNVSNNSKATIKDTSATVTNTSSSSVSSSANISNTSVIPQNSAAVMEVVCATYYILTTVVDSSGSGTVSLDPPGGLYDPGTVVQITANAKDGYKFDHWSGNLTDDTNPTTIIMDSDKNVIAHFVTKCPVIVVSSDTSVASDLQSFRDNIMSGSKAGQEFIGIYYKHSEAVASILVDNKMLMLRSEAILKDVMPGIRFLMGAADGKDIVMNALLVYRIKSLFDDIGDKGSPELSQTMGMLSDILESHRGERISQLWQSISKSKPDDFALLQNIPNPFNPDTWIPYQLPGEADVTISIYDAAGRHVRTLELGQKQAGFYITKDKAAYWDGRNEAGESAASGIYFYTIQAGDFMATRKMLIVK